jgi:hypothetical protein
MSCYHNDNQIITNGTMQAVLHYDVVHDNKLIE